MEATNEDLAWARAAVRTLWRSCVAGVIRELRLRMRGMRP